MIEMMMIQVKEVLSKNVNQGNYTKSKFSNIIARNTIYYFLGERSSLEIMA